MQLADIKAILIAQNASKVKRNVRDINSVHPEMETLPKRSSKVFHFTSVEPDEGAILGVLSALKVSGVRAL